MNSVQSLLFAALTFSSIAHVSEVGANDAKTGIGDAQSCAMFLPGSWTGEGTVEGFGPPRKVASSATYERDGSFTSTTRYLGADNEWVEQVTKGSWNSEPTRSSRICSLTLKSVTESGSASSTSQFTIIDTNTYRAFGVDLKRVR